MKRSRAHGRLICGSLAAAAALSPVMSLTAWADNISTANFNLRQKVVKLTGIMEIFQLSRGSDPRRFCKDAG